MKLPHGYRGRLSSVCGKKGHSASILQNPHLDVDKKLLITTDGRAIVVIPVIVEDGETSGSVPVKAIRIWMDGTKKNQAVHSKSRRVTLHCGERVVVRGYEGEETSYPRDEAKFPSWESTFAKPPSGKPTICLNAEILALAQKAMGSDFISIWITEADQAIYVAGDSLGPYLSLVMPARTDRVTAPTIASLKAQ